MVLQRWSPFRELRDNEDAIERMWRDFGGNGESVVENWNIPLDVIREGDKLTVHASLPGVDPDNIDVLVEDNVLTVKAKTQSEYEHNDGEYLMRERRSGSFHRALSLPDTVDTGKTQPTYRNGVLTITIPRAESKKARHLKVLSQ